MIRAFRGVDIEVGEGNGGAVGIYAAGAQGMSVDDVHVDMSRSGFAGKLTVDCSHSSSHTNIYGNIAMNPGFGGGNGAGGSHVNIGATGGAYGVYFTISDGAAVVLSAKLLGQSVSAVFFETLSERNPTGSSTIVSMSLVGLEVLHSGSGPAVAAGLGHGLTVLDSQIMCGQNASASVAVRATRANAYLSGVFSDCATLLQQPGTRHADMRSSSAGAIVHAIEVARGANNVNRNATAESDLAYIDGIRHANYSIGKTAVVSRVPVGVVAKRSPWDSRSFPSVLTAVDAVTQCGAMGDGRTDDTTALQRCLDTHERVLLPRGLFRISATLRMRPNTALLGVSQTHSVIAPLTSGFASSSKTQSGRETEAVPMLQTSSTGNATVAFIGLTTWWHLPSIFTLEWRARSGLWRSNYETRVCECLWLNNYVSAVTSPPCAAPSILATPKTKIRGGGIFVNFVNDEDILFTDHTHYRHVQVYDGGAGSSRVVFYGLNMEHAMSEANLEISGATQGVDIISLKTEGSNVIVWARDSSDVNLYSLGGGSDAFPNRSYYPPDFAPYEPTILRIERTAPYRLVNLNDAGRGNEGRPIVAIPPPTARNGFPLNRSILEDA